MEKELTPESLLNEIKSIDQILTPHMPVNVFIQEAENLFVWAGEDKEALIARGFTADLFDKLPMAIDVCRKAEAEWYKTRRVHNLIEKEWIKKSDIAYNLRNTLLAELDFAFYNNKALQGRIDLAREGNSHSDMIQDLANLSQLGNENLDLLAKINFDTSLLAQAQTLGLEIANLLAQVNGERTETHETKILRDKAFTYTKHIVDEMRRYGKFVFRTNKERLKGYRSEYRRKKVKIKEETE